MRAASLVAFLVFGAFAAVQLNDPDAFVWTLIYGYAAMLSLMAAINVKVTLPALVGAAAYAATAWKLFPGFGQPLMPLEEGREALGLLICSAWSLALAITSLAALRKLPKHSSSSEVPTT